MIKWSGLCLIVLQTVFAVLNDFFHPSPVNPDSTNDLVPAIPVLAYLFHIALGVLYAACVIFYALSSGRWRHAFPLRNLPYALASFVSICSPVVFFCLDIWSEQVDGWGDYVRWVSMIAASVLVWDWVDRIEAQISKDSLTGVLGREVFEDEMLDSKAKKYHDGSKKNNFLIRTWKKRSTDAPNTTTSRSAELPIIMHPIVRSRRAPSSNDSGAEALRSNPTSTGSYAPTTTTQSSDTVGSYRPGPSQGGQHDRDSCDRSNSSATLPSEHSISTDVPQHASCAETCIQSQDITYVHPGFNQGDYWHDEKSSHDDRIQ